MNGVFSEELYLTNATGRLLYHKYAEGLPIIDYHCHLQPREICENKQFEDLGEMWLSGDHYKWRAMRTFGIDEKYITGDASYYEKYMAFAGILPLLAGNPIYIWCALELKRFFGIDEPLSEENAQRIYDSTKAAIREKNMTPQRCMEISNVELVSTTEDPVDDLRYHVEIAKNRALKTRVITAFRPDKAMAADQPGFAAYMLALQDASGVGITGFATMMDALETRLQYFRQVTGTNVSDDGIPYFSWADYTDEEVEAIWARANAGQPLSEREADQYRSAFLFEMGRRYHRNGFVMQLHVGTYLNANTRFVREVGTSTGFDCTADDSSVKGVGELLNRLCQIDELPKTILYPLDSAKIETFAVLAAAYCYGGVKGKVQLGAPWWFNDTAYGIRRQFEAIANLYPLSLSVGMLTDSRSFLSYPRHELYRRVLCNYLGSLVEQGEYFAGEEALAKIVRDVCYNNVKEYFGF